MQGVHKLDSFPHCVIAAAAAIEEVLRKKVFGRFPQFVLLGKMVRVE